MIETARLRLRVPDPRDFDALHAMWSDSLVMRDLGPEKTPAQSRAALARHQGYRDRCGLGFWVAERRDDGLLAGFCGLKPGAPGTPIEGEVEIGWMFVRSCWGQGFAQEAARAGLTWGWQKTDAARIVAITAQSNLASRKLMARLGMTQFTEFDHPGFPIGSPWRESVGYQIRRP